METRQCIVPSSRFFYMTVLNSHRKYCAALFSEMVPCKEQRIFYRNFFYFILYLLVSINYCGDDDDT